MNDSVLKLTQNLLRGIITMCLLFIGATFLSLFFKRLGFNESNIIMVYILCVMLTAYFTEGYLISFLASIIGVMTFNYFFTEPYFSFEFYHSDYAVTFIFMFISALLTSMLTYRIRTAVKISLERERRTALLYHIGQRLIRAENASEMIDIVGQECSRILGVETVIATTASIGVTACTTKESFLLKSYQYFMGGSKQVDEKVLAAHHYQSMDAVYAQRKTVVDYKKNSNDQSMYYIPLDGQTVCYGVIGFKILDNEVVSEEKEDHTHAIASLMVMALERILFQAEQQKIELKIESEHLRGNLLRAISHDLRTPLSGILGATNTILDNFGHLDPNSMVELLENVHMDTQWLIHTVENILSLTRIEEGGIALNMQGEYIDEIIAEVLRLSAKNIQDYNIEVEIDDNGIMIEMDGQLIKQVLLNLIDNATKFTPIHSTIVISVNLQEINNMAVIRIRDNGKGIDPQALEAIFDRFYTSTNYKQESRRGIGLGLEICKAIVEAHKGTIVAYNAQDQGAVFEITLPVMEGGHDEL